MSKKVTDPHGRWRNILVAFRVSPEESTLLNDLVKLSGLTKQDYLIQRVLEKDVIVQGTPRVYKALKTYMERIYFELRRLVNADELQPELLDLIRFVAIIYDGMKTENNEIWRKK